MTSSPTGGPDSPNSGPGSGAFPSAGVTEPRPAEYSNNGGPPLMTKAVASAMCGMFSLPMCLCAGFPSIILGSVAIWLGIWVRKNYRGNTASEMANMLSWVGTIAGGIGIVLGVIFVIMMLLGTAGGIIGAITDGGRY